MSIVKKGVYLGFLTWITAAVPFWFVMKMDKFPVLLLPISLVVLIPLIIVVVHYILKPVPVGKKDISGLKFGVSLVLVHVFLDFVAMLFSVNAPVGSGVFSRPSAHSQINSFFFFYIFYFLAILLSWLIGRYEDKKARN